MTGLVSLENKYKEPIEYSITDYAKSFISGLSDRQRSKFKIMLDNGYESGLSVAKSYGVDYKAFITEVKKQLGVI